MLKKLSAVIVACIMMCNVIVGASACDLKMHGKYLSHEAQWFKQFARISANDGLKNKHHKNPSNKGDREIRKNLEEYLNATAKYQNFHGTVYVAKEGRVILSKGYGKADYEKNIPNTSETRFAIGSMTKQFTAMAIMQLYEKGRIKLDDKLSRYIPDFSRGDEITIHQLLTHTSGITDYTDLEELWNLKPENITQDVIINLFKDKPLDFNPGESWSYSNSGYLLLGVIVEKITGKSLGEYLRKNIFVPLKMNNTGECYKDGKVMLDTKGYVGYLDIEPLDDTISFKAFCGAGNLYSTVGDLYRWDRALYTNKLVSKKTMELIFTPHADTKSIGYYGYGWFINGEGRDKEYYHSGVLQSFNSIISRFPGRDTCIIVLSNNSDLGLSGEEVKNNINSILLGKQIALPVEKKAIALDPSTLESLVGSYEIIEGVNINITRENEHLFADVTGLGKFEILAQSETEFFNRMVNAQITCVKGENGEIVELVMHFYGMDTLAKKVINPIPVS